MKKQLTFFLFTLSLNFCMAQNFELNRDLEDGTVSFQGIIEVDSTDKSELISTTKDWFEAREFKQDFVSEDLEKNEQIYKFTHEVVGKKSELGNAFHYRFTSLLKIEFKENKIRYTFYEFRKKSSPGEPGSSMEAYIENYKPKISSTRSRERAAARLDEIELELYAKVSDVILNLKNTFGTTKQDDW